MALTGHSTKPRAASVGTQAPSAWTVVWRMADGDCVADAPRHRLGRGDLGPDGIAARKQRMIEELIEAREFTAFPDAVRFIHAVRAKGVRLAVASSSKNANQMSYLQNHANGVISSYRLM